jgi:uncharacterized tellurite resistance protein B-like protein
MPTAILLVVLLLVLTAAISLAVLHWRFQRWPPSVWKHLLARRVAELRSRRDDLRAEAAGDAEAGVAQLADDYFRRHLQTIPLDQLADFPGIGPGTLDRLRQAGCRGLGDVAAARVESIHGIGRTRAKDLSAAVGSLVRAARSRFDAGACAEAHEYRRQCEQILADGRKRALMRDRERAAVDAALRECDALTDIARRVTFWKYVSNQDIPDLTDTILSRPLPTPRVARPIPVAPLVTPDPVPTRSQSPPRAPAVVSAKAAPRSVVGAPIAPARDERPSPLPPADLFRAELQKPVEVPEPHRTEHPWLRKMRAVTGLGFVVAKADGRVAEAERRAIRTFLGTTFGHDGVLVRHIDPLMEQTEAAVPDETAALLDVCKLTTGSERAELYAFAERVADASGGRNARECAALARIAAMLGVQPQTPRVHPSPASTPAPAIAATAGDECKALLNIPPDAPLTVDLIRRRYTLLTEKLDPARAASLGPEFRRMADEKRVRIRAAAETLLAPFNAPLDPPAAPPPADLRHNPDLDDVFGA